MQPSNLARNAMQLARKMVGQNELSLAHEIAMDVFRAHGGVLDADGAPQLGLCVRTECKQHACEMQKLAFSALLSLSVFETAQEQVVESVLQRIAQEVRHR